MDKYRIIRNKIKSPAFFILFYIVLFCLIGSSFFFSCSEKEDVDYGYGEYYVEMATVLTGKTFLLDCGKTVYNQKEIEGLKEGERILFNYSYLNRETNNVTIRYIKRVFSGNLEFVDSEKIQEYENIPVRLESVWLSNHYLNFQFYMEYLSEAHTVSLYADKLEMNKDEIRLYFLHNKNNDSPGYWKSSTVSFDLQKELEPSSNKRLLIVHVVSENYGKKEYKFEY